ncbi:MAG: class I SAM-dependent methyltransferase [Patulibacter sp.]
MDIDNTPGTIDAGLISIYELPRWQMAFGERAAFEGLLTQVKPTLAIEIGTARGGSLDRIAAHAAEVHSFDLIAPDPAARALENVTFHTGDSHVWLPRKLQEFADQGRNVDFVLVDGDHSTDGVRQDIEDLLASQACAHTVIVLHDTTNEVVRAGIEQAEAASWPHVAYVEYDLVPGYCFATPGLRYELWGGLGVIITNAGRLSLGKSVVQDRYYPAADVLRRGRDLMLAAGQRENGAPLPERLRSAWEAADYARLAVEAEHLRDDLERTRAALDAERAAHERLRSVYGDVMSSISWKLTRPLRGLKGRVRGG